MISACEHLDFILFLSFAPKEFRSLIIFEEMIQVFAGFLYVLK